VEEEFFCPVFMLWTSVFKLYIFLLSTNNNRSESMYCEGRSRFFEFLNKSLQESLLLLTGIVLIAFFCILRIFVLYVEFSQNIICYDVVE
jgi:hypothetical protein